MGFKALKNDWFAYSLDRYGNAPMALVLVVRQLDVEVRNAHAIQFLTEVLVISGSFLSLILGAVERSSGGEMNRHLVSRTRGTNICQTHTEKGARSRKSVRHRQTRP